METGKVEELDQRRAVLEEDAVRLQNELEGVLEREAAALDEIDGMRHDLADREREFGLLAKARDEDQEQITILSQGIAEREDQIHGLEGVRAELSGRIAELENELFPLRDRHADAQATLDTVELELLQLHDENDETQESLELALGRVEDMKVMVGEYDRTLADERAEKEELIKAAEQLNVDLQEITERRDAAREDARELGERLASTKVDLDGALLEKSEFAETLESLQRELSDLQSEHAATTSHSRELEEELAGTLDLLDTSVSDRAELEETKQYLERDLEQLREKRAAAVSRAEQLSGRIESLEIQLDKANEAVALSSGEISELHLDLSLRDRLLDEARHEAGESKEELGRLKPELQHLYTTELPDALEQKVRAFRQVQKMKVEIELLRSQLW